MQGRLSKFMANAFAVNFLSIFATLFVLSSVITLVRLADITSVAQVDGADFLKIFSFALPNILFYVIPASFFLSSIIALSKLSQDREMVALFALGLSPSKLLRPFAILAAATSVLLLFLGLFLSPLASNAAKQLVEDKKTAAKLNIHPSELGQRFGDWLVFVSGIDGTLYKDIALFSIGSGDWLGKKTDEKTLTDKIIYAKHGRLSNENGLLSLTLDGGVGYAIEQSKSKNVRKVEFSRMIIRQSLTGSFEHYDGPITYWLKAQSDQKRAKDFSNILLTAFFPLASICWILLAGIYNPRHQKNRAVVYAAVLLVAYYTLILTVTPKLLLWGVPLVLSVWFALSWRIFVKKFAP